MQISEFEPLLDVFLYKKKNGCAERSIIWPQGIIKTI